MASVPLYVYHLRGPHKVSKVDIRVDPQTGEDAALLGAAREAIPYGDEVLAGERYVYHLPTLEGTSIAVHMWATDEERLILSRVPLTNLYSNRLNSTCKVWANIGAV